MPSEEVTTDIRVCEEPKEDELPKSRGFERCWRLCRNVLLVAAMTGNEICISFAHLYEVPLLQILGVPVTYVSLYPIVTGPLAMILLSLSGHFSDKGSNHHKRKTIVLVLVSIIIVLGIALLVMTNLIFLFTDKSANTTDSTNGISDSEDIQFQNNSLFAMVNVSFENASGVFSSANANMAAHGNHSYGQDDFEEEDGGSLSLTAYLGLAAFGLIDIGYAVNQAATRSCVLACSAKSDHPFILILALAMAAVGGCFNNLLGLLDLSHVVPVGAGEGSLLAQTTTQLMICSAVLVVCLFSTVVTALINIHNLHNNSLTPLAEKDTVTEQTCHYGTFDTERKSWETENWLETTLYNSFSDMEHVIPEEVDKFLETTQIFRKNRSNSMTDDATSQLTISSIVGNPPLDAGILDLSITIQQLSPTSSLILYSEIDSDTEDLPAWKCCGWLKHKVNFIVACIVTYLGSSVFFCYNLYVADFLGKAVKGGDSSAPHGSAEFKAYEDGVSLAAGGLLTAYSCYFFVSTAQSKLLKLGGLKADFCLSHLLMSAAILSLILLKNVAAFYVCSVIFSFQRSAVFTVSFLIANSYVHEQEKMGQPQTGKMTAILAWMVPLNYCTAFLISGPLITFTQYDGAPLVLSSAFTGLAALLFLFLYKP